MPTTTARIDLVRAKANLSLLLDRARARLSGAESPDPERGRGGEGLDGDAAQSLIQREEAFISGERVVLEIRALLAALRRVDAGTYGECAAIRAALPRATETHAAQYLASLIDGMGRHAIDTPARIAAFLAQVGHESGDLARPEENLRYSAAALLRVWPSRFKTLAVARQYERKPEAIANLVYASRMGNGDVLSGDGWRFHGRGLIQLTGRANYAAYAAWSLETPDWLAEAPDAALSACWFWATRGCNELADAGGFERITRVINGGTHGLEDRRARWAIARAALDAEAA